MSMSLEVVLTTTQYWVPALTGIPALSLATDMEQHCPYGGSFATWKDSIGFPGTPFESLHSPSSKPAVPLPWRPAEVSIFVTMASAVGVNATAAQVWKGKFE